MITRKVAPALAAGCSVVCKPAEATPLTALALAALAERADMPLGVFNIITCSGSQVPEVGRILCASPMVRKLSFTGSTEVGRLLMRQSAVPSKNSRWNSAAMRPLSSLTMPILMLRWRVP